MIPVLASIVSGLIANNMPKVADAVMDKGLDYVQDKLGIQLKPEHEMTQDDIKFLQERAMQHEEFMAEQQGKEMANARQREIDLASDERVPMMVKIVVPVLALGVTGFSFLLFALLIFVDVKPENKDILIYVLGSLTGAVTMVLGYYFGSSLGSKDKDKMKGLGL
jgi:hypothetical protein